MCGQPLDPDINVLWGAHYDDGPRTGLVLFQDALCWFQLVDDSAENWEYDVFPMTDAEVRFVVTEHYKFEIYVGCHTCYHVSADRKRNLALQWWSKYGPSPIDSPFYRDRPGPWQSPPTEVVPIHPVATEGKVSFGRFSWAQLWHPSS